MDNTGAIDTILASGWCLLPKQILFDHQLTDKEKLLYAFISSYTAERGYCWASNEYLATKFACTPKWISTCINKIKRRGYFKVLLIRDSITDQVRQRRIYLSIPQLSSIQAPESTKKGGVSHKKRGGIPEKWEYNKERLLKKEEVAPPPPYEKTYLPNKTATLIAAVFADTDPDTDFAQRDIAAILYQVLSEVSLDHVQAAHIEQLKDEKRRSKGETGFAWLFDVNWHGKYAIDRITRYAKKHIDKRAQIQRQAQLKAQSQRPAQPEEPAADPERAAAIIGEALAKFRR
jgi:hypothetical protein